MVGSINSNLLDDQMAKSSGWGYIEEKQNGNIRTDDLMWTSFQILSQARCKATWGNFITNRMICGLGENDSGVCSGDSGGPLVYEDPTNGPILIGATSWSESNCQVQYPDGWARLSEATTWILANTNLSPPTVVNL